MENSCIGSFSESFFEDSNDIEGLYFLYNHTTIYLQRLQGIESR